MRARLFITSIFLAAATSLGASDLWIHVRVVDNTHRPTNVEINLPFRLIERLAPMLDEHRHRGARIHFGHDDLNVEELRDLWTRVRTGESVVHDDATLQLQSDPRGDRLVVRDRYGDGKVVTLPADVIDALLSAPGDRLDFEAAVRALARYGEGEIVTADDDGTTVRIWIDRNPESR